MTTFLTVLIHLAVVVSSVLLIIGVIKSRQGGSDLIVHDVMEAAFLGGGPGRVAEAAIAGMHADGRLVVGWPAIVAVRRSTARNPVEQAVLEEHADAPDGGLHTLRLAVMRSRAVQQVGDALSARGLLVTPGVARTWRRRGVVQGVVCLVALPVVFLLALLALTSLSVRPALGSLLPFSLLPTLCAGAVIGLVCASVAGRRITGAGRKAHQSFRTGVPFTAPVEFLVAAHGLPGVPDRLLRAQLRIATMTRPETTSTSYQSTSAGTPQWCSGAHPGSGCGAGSCGGGSSHGGGGSDGSGDNSSCGSGSSCGGGSSCGSSGD